MRYYSQFLLLGALLSGSLATNAQSHAQEGPRIRTFACFIRGTGENDQRTVPDFLSESSKVVTALPAATGSIALGGTIQFVDTQSENFSWDDYQQPSYLDGAVFRVHPAHHAVKGGGKQEEGTFWLWKETVDCPQPPPAGAHTLTGPDGLILSQDVFLLSYCEAGSCYGDTTLDGQWIVKKTEQSPGPPASDRIVFVTALFSR